VLIADRTGVSRPDTPANRAADRALPGEWAVREVRARVGRPGFRTRVLVVVTTLTGPAVTAAEIADR
jgi:hypothetical protein